ncbi:unnamed protein product [Absidia cylindrospora]
MHYPSLSILFFFILFWTNTYAAITNIKRGIATMMSFDDENSHGLMKRNRGTWYSGKGLQDAACYGRKGLPKFSAKPSDMIGAMAMQDHEYCYECMHITNTKNHHSVIVKIVDKCEGCVVGEAVDLTPEAFKKLNPEGLEVGVLNIKWNVVECPESIKLRWSS